MYRKVSSRLGGIVLVVGEFFLVFIFCFVREIDGDFSDIFRESFSRVEIIFALVWFFS